jgi:ATP-binding cassette subfamily A (ABC1) protein 3
MSDGRLVCSGSTLFLKNKFGVGYNITIAKRDPKVSSQPIINLVTKHVPNCKVTTDVSAEVAMQLPMEEVDRFPKLFDELDAKKKELDFESYGVSITTLEEVFLKVAEIRKDSEEDNSDK